jgi:hypothetical protein
MPAFGQFRIDQDPRPPRHFRMPTAKGLIPELNRGSDDDIDQPAKMPALSGASADPLRFLDFLIREPVRRILRNRSGIPVVVPDPSRYAVHKLIVASRQHTDAPGSAKREKDIRQVALLFEALQQTRRSADLAHVYNEAWRAGRRGKTVFEPGTGCCRHQMPSVSKRS